MHDIGQCTNDPIVSLRAGKTSASLSNGDSSVSPLDKLWQTSNLARRIEQLDQIGYAAGAGKQPGKTLCLYRALR
jgi:hypothetical protein